MIFNVLNGGRRVGREEFCILGGSGVLLRSSAVDWIVRVAIFIFNGTDSTSDSASVMTIPVIINAILGVKKRRGRLPHNIPSASDEVVSKTVIGSEELQLGSF